MSRMLKSAGAMGVATLVSRLLGMVREICYARFMGDGWVAGAFMLAFMIPNLFRRLLGEGALTQVFIPIFKAKEKKEGEVEMWRSANAVMSGLLVVSAVLLGVVLAGVSAVLAWGELGDRARLMLELLRWMFPYMGLVCMAAVAMGILNARGHFFVPALGPAILNVFLIAAVLLFAPMIEGGVEDKVFAVAVAVLVAGVVQLLYQWPLMKEEGFRWQWTSPWKNETVRAVGRKLAPAAIGAAAFQINVLATQCLGFWAGDHVVASYTYAVRLMELPQGLFGVSMAVFLLPTLAGLSAEEKDGEFRATLGEGIRHLLFINGLMMWVLVLLAEPMVRLLFERGEFTDKSTLHVSFALICLAPALLSYSQVGLLVRAFNARGDVRTPMKISVFCLFVNLGLAMGLVASGWFGEEEVQGAFGVANSLSAFLNWRLLARALSRRGLGPDRLDGGGWAAVLGSLCLAIAVGAGLRVMSGEWWGAGDGFWERLGLVFVPLAGMIGMALAAGVFCGVPTARQIWDLMAGRRVAE
ncbi:MAG: murein biosynthesis integral membrane protein MurJ [Verrucomicrobiales bacterium]|nr:murein biosynthesis integral membrane protein MurJ [Verrucomicrobiales bacterium]